VPAGQAEQDADPKVEYLPAAQGVQKPKVTELEYVPAGQLAKTVLEVVVQVSMVY